MTHKSRCLRSTCCILTVAPAQRESWTLITVSRNATVTIAVTGCVQQPCLMTSHKKCVYVLNNSGSNTDNGKKLFSLPYNVQIDIGATQPSRWVYRGSWSMGKAAGTWGWPLISIQCRCYEWVGLYPNSTNTPSWQVQEQFHLHQNEPIASQHAIQHFARTESSAWSKCHINRQTSVRKKQSK